MVNVYAFPIISEDLASFTESIASLLNPTDTYIAVGFDEDTGIWGWNASWGSDFNTALQYSLAHFDKGEQLPASGHVSEEDSEEFFRAHDIVAIGDMVHTEMGSLLLIACDEDCHRSVATEEPEHKACIDLLTSVYSLAFTDCAILSQLILVPELRDADGEICGYKVYFYPEDINKLIAKLKLSQQSGSLDLLITDRIALSLLSGEMSGEHNQVITPDLTKIESTYLPMLEYYLKRTTAIPVVRNSHKPADIFESHGDFDGLEELTSLF